MAQGAPQQPIKGIAEHLYLVLEMEERWWEGIWLAAGEYREEGACGRLVHNLSGECLVLVGDLKAVGCWRLYEFSMLVL